MSLMDACHRVGQGTSGLVLLLVWTYGVAHLFRLVSLPHGAVFKELLLVLGILNLLVRFLGPGNRVEQIGHSKIRSQFVQFANVKPPGVFG